MNLLTYLIFSLLCGAGQLVLLGHVKEAAQSRQQERFVVTAIAMAAWLVFCGVMAARAAS